MQAEKQLNNEVTSREVLNSKYNVLLEKQRNYFKAVKEFQDECFRNERLTESIERYTRFVCLASGGCPSFSPSLLTLMCVMCRAAEQSEAPAETDG